MPVAQTRLESLQTIKLLQCVRTRDWIQIEKLIVNGVPDLVTYNDSNDGETALTLAASTNDLEMVRFLLKHGAHPDAVDLKGRSAVSKAAEMGYADCVKILAMSRASMKTKDSNGKGALFYCLTPSDKHLQCLETVLKYGADVNTRSDAGVPVLVMSCETAAQNEDICLALLHGGADPSISDLRTRRTALMAAAASGSEKVVGALLERHNNVNDVTMRTAATAAHEAAKIGNVKILQILAAYGADFSLVDEEGNTALHVAAQYGRDLACRFIAQRGQRTNSLTPTGPKLKNKNGMTAKKLALREKKKKAARECGRAERQSGKAIKHAEPWAIALYDFCYHHRQQLLDLFDRLDADRLGRLPAEEFTDALRDSHAPLPDGTDWTRLVTLFVKENAVDFTEFIKGKLYVNKRYRMSAFDKKKKKKKRGRRGKRSKGKTKVRVPICTRDIGPRRDDGGPPETFVPRHIHMTDKNRFDEARPPRHMFEDDSPWYLHPSETTYMNLNDAVRHCDLETLKDAFSKDGGAAVNIRDRFYKTPLMVAASEGSSSLMKLLIETGADVNAQDNFQWTPLHFACRSGRLKAVQCLLDSKAKINALTLGGASPIMRAIESGRPDVVQLLLDRGATLDAVTKKGKTPLDLAIAYGDMRVYDIVKAKWDALGMGSSKTKRPLKKSNDTAGKRTSAG